MAQAVPQDLPCHLSKATAARSVGKLLVLLAAMPPLISAIAVAREYELEADLSGEIAAFGASAALVTVPLWATALEYLS